MGRPRVSNEHRVVTAVRIPLSLYERLRATAYDRDTSINHLVCKAAEAYLARLDEVPLEKVS